MGTAFNTCVEIKLKCRALLTHSLLSTAAPPLPLSVGTCMTPLLGLLLDKFLGDFDNFSLLHLGVFDKSLGDEVGEVLVVEDGDARLVDLDLTLGLVDFCRCLLDRTMDSSISSTVSPASFLGSSTLALFLTTHAISLALLFCILFLGS